MSESKRAGLALSKSRYLCGLQCPKLLWLRYNAPEEVPPPDKSSLDIFEQGHLVGDFAKKIFPDGVEVDHSRSFEYGLTQTEDLLKKRVPIFEAAFKAENCYFRADILVPSDQNRWDIIEVKSSGDLKDINNLDVGFQLHAAKKAGLDVRRCYLALINKNYVRNGDIEPSKLFNMIDLTSSIEEFAKVAEEQIPKMLETIASDCCPDPGIGNHCKKPFRCPMFDKCRSFLPERNVFFLYRGKELPFQLVNAGIYELAKVDVSGLTKHQSIQVECEKTGQPHIDEGEIYSFLKNIEYPAFYMDFETWMSAIPMFDGGSPYEIIPFQFSVHEIAKEGSEPKHTSFLYDGVDDPRPAFMRALMKCIGPKGSIVSYNASFERNILQKSSEIYPEFAEWFKSLENRFVDPLILFRSFAYYHPQQNGSCSIKKVLPVITGQSYESMSIGQGMDASREYFRVTFTDDNSDKEKIRKALEEYCCLDTMAMVDIVGKLREMCGM